MARHADVVVAPHEALAEYVAVLEANGLPELLAPVRVARLLDIDRRRVYELMGQGELAAVRVGRKGLRVFRQSLLDWLRGGGSGVQNYSTQGSPVPPRCSRTEKSI